MPGRFQILAGKLNALASLVTLAAGCSLFFLRPAPTRLIFIDDFNIYLVVLTTFVGFTTSVFSAGYIRHELESGRLDAAQAALLSRDVSGLHLHHAAGAGGQ